MPRPPIERHKSCWSPTPISRDFRGPPQTIPSASDRAVEEAGLQHKVHVVGTSLPSLSGNLLKSGAVESISFWDPKLAGMAMCEIAVRLLNGQTVKDGDDLGIEGYHHVAVKGNVIKGAAWIDVTKENMDQYKL